MGNNVWSSQRWREWFGWWLTDEVSLELTKVSNIEIQIHQSPRCQLGKEKDFSVDLTVKCKQWTFLPFHWGLRAAIPLAPWGRLPSQWRRMDLKFPRFLDQKSSNPKHGISFSFSTSPSPTVSAVGGSRGPHSCFSANREVGMHSKTLKDWMWTKDVPKNASVMPGESTGLRPSSSMPSLVVAALWGSEAQSFPPNSDGLVDLAEFTQRFYIVEFGNFKVSTREISWRTLSITSMNFVLLTSKLSKPTKGWLPPSSAIFTILLGDIQLRAGAGGRASNGEKKGWCRPQWLKLRDSTQFQDAWWTNWLMI